MMVHTALFINPMRKQLIHVESEHHLQIIKKFQDLLKKDYPAYLQQRKYLKIRKIAMSRVYDNVDITKN